MGAGGRPIDRALAAARPLAERFRRRGHTFYLVGGVVRDQFLEQADADPDLDCTTDARPERIHEIVDEIADATWDQGEEFGTIGCRIGSIVFEITTHRADAYEPHSRKPVVAFGDTIEDDLARRDFTVNSMAVDMADGRFIDPVGGRNDLDAGILRTPLDPAISFSEDPLRMLRAARFIAGYGLAPVPELGVAVAEMVDRIGIVSVERIRDELEKLLLLDDPSSGIDFMVATGLWGRLFPRFDDATASGRGSRVRVVAPVRAERWAAFLFHDGRHEMDHLRLSKALQADIRWLLAVAAHLTAHPPSGDRDLRLAGQMVPEGERLERAADFTLALASVDESTASPPNELRVLIDDLRSREPDFDSPVLPLDGEQVMELLELEPGPDVGRALDLLRSHRVDHGPFDADEAARILRQA